MAKKTESKLQDLFVLPNGSSLKYEFTTTGQKTGGQEKWWRTQGTQIFWKRTKSKYKTSLPKLGFWNSKTNQHIICADFDERPKEYDTWDEFYSHLKKNYDDKGIILRSASGINVKALFLVEKDNLLPPTDSEAIDCLSRINPIFSTSSDKKGLRLSFVNEEMAKIISSKLPKLPVIDHIHTTEFAEAVTNEPHNITKQEMPGHESKPAEFYNGNLPEKLNKFITYYGSKSEKQREQLIRFILAKPKKALAELYLPTPYLANELKTSHQNIKNWINRLIKFGWLQVKSNKYKPGKYSKCYKANGSLKEVCLSLSQLTPSNGYRPPKIIADGEWDNHLFRAIEYYKDESRFKMWFYSLPDCKLKNREKKMQDHIKSWRKKQNQSNRK